MKTYFNNLIISTFLILFFGMASNGYAENNSCPAVNCDCASLPTDKWVSVCQQYEAHLKKECVGNSNTPKNYCSIHGENATPVALSLSVPHDISLPEVFRKANIDANKLDNDDLREKLDEKLNLTLWSLKADLASTQKMLTKSEFNMAVQALKVLDNNLELAMEQNLTRILSSEQVEGLKGKDLQERKAEVWLEYGEKINEVAMLIEEFADQMETQMQVAKTAKDMKVGKVFSTMAYRSAGKAFEQGGYAFGRAGNHVKAANTWNHAADLSAQLTALEKSSGDSAGPSYSELQSAARMYRASYHWLMNESFYDSNMLLAKSQSLVNAVEQKNIQALIGGSEKASSLSVR